MNPLWLAIELPHLALDLLTRAQAPGTDLPVIISNNHARRPLVLDSNPAARRFGIHAGIPVSAALALAENAWVGTHDPATQQQALQRLAGWAYQYSSQISVLPERQSLVLEAAGSRRLFGSVQSLAKRLEQQLSELGYHSRIGIGPTPEAACLAARQGMHLQHQQDLHKALDSLPLEALAIDQAQQRALEKMGFCTIRELLRLPRKSLARRLGPALVDYLDRLCGIRSDPQTAWHPPASWSAQLELIGETHHSQALLFPLKRLTQELCGALRAGDFGVQQLLLTIQLRHGQEQLELNLQQPDRDASRIMSLLGERLERLRLSSPARALELSAGCLLPFTARQAGLFSDQTEASDDALAPLLERLQARLGERAVYGLTGVADHRPEYSWGQRAPSSPARCKAMPHRPLWLYQQPRPCKISEYEVLAGPERIESGWWDGRDCRRDYFIVQDRQGSRLWAYREYKPGTGWYLHGLFG